MDTITEETRLPTDIDAQPLVQAAAALRIEPARLQSVGQRQHFAAESNRLRRGARRCLPEKCASPIDQQEVGATFGKTKVHVSRLRTADVLIITNLEGARNCLTRGNEGSEGPERRSPERHKAPMGSSRL